MTNTGLTVAVTGPTGDLGLGIVDALERSRAVKRIVGMARRPFDPAERGWRKTEYRRGDVTDTATVRALVKDAHVVVHLAFAVLDASSATRDLNVEGSRRVFEESVKAGAERICYASSVAAYGFHDDNPDWLTEDIPARGSPEFPYSNQKAEVEQVLAATLLNRRSTSAYVFRPCIVAGPEARMMLEAIPYFRLSEAMPDVVVRLLGVGAGAQARDPRSRRALPARALGGRGARVRRRRSRRRRARPLQPGRGWDADLLAPRDGDGLVLGADPEAWRRWPPPRSPAACRSPRRRSAGCTPCASRS